MDSAISELRELQHEQSQEEGTQGSRKGFSPQINKQRKSIRESLAKWHMWLHFYPPAGEPLPYVDDFAAFRGEVPWVMSSTRSKTAEAFKLDLYKISSELQRTKEEKVYLSVDACVLLHYYWHQRTVILRHALSCASLSRGMGCMLRAKLGSIARLEAAACKSFAAVRMLDDVQMVRAGDGWVLQKIVGGGGV